MRVTDPACRRSVESCGHGNARLVRATDGLPRGGLHARTQRRLTVEGDQLTSAVNGKRYGIGTLTMPALDELRARVDVPAQRRTTVRCLVADVAALHSEPEFDGALFQVASQFNMLEMISPNVSPEDGVARYTGDHTQGPACAIAAGAATIYRNYCAPIGGEVGQTKDRFARWAGPAGSVSVDSTSICPFTSCGRCATAMHSARPRGSMRSTSSSSHAPRSLAHELRGKLAIGLHRNVEVTRVQGHSPHVSQVFCSALPVAYSPLPTLGLGAVRAARPGSGVRGDTAGRGGGRRHRHRAVDPVGRQRLWQRRRVDRRRHRAGAGDRRACRSRRSAGELRPDPSRHAEDRRRLELTAVKSPGCPGPSRPDPGPAPLPRQWWLM